MWQRVIVLMLFPLFGYSQDQSQQYIDRGLLRAQGNISMGIPSYGGGSNFYIAGDLEYYTSSAISIRGSSNYFLGSSEGKFDMNHSILLGALIHFKTAGNFDPYIGIEPGFAISKLAGDPDPANQVFWETSPPPSSYPQTLNPIFTASIGFNYYADKYFSLFANVRLVQGKHYSDIAAVSLNEIKFAFGLGWHLWARKGYCKFKKPAAS